MEKVSYCQEVAEEWFRKDT